MLGNANDEVGYGFYTVLLYFGELIRSKLGPTSSVVVCIIDSSAMLFRVAFDVRAFFAFLPFSLMVLLVGFAIDILGSYRSAFKYCLFA